MRKRRQIWLAAIVVTLLTVIASFLVQPDPDPLFRGRPESDWISSVRYYDERQAEQWREFGLEGVQVLTRGLEKLLRAKDYRYLVFYRQVPFQLRRLLPAPKMDATRGKRMSIIFLLVQLNSDMPETESLMVKELEDLDPSVRSLAITYFTHSEDGNAALAKMSAERKKKLLPLFLSASQDSDMGLRNNGIVALNYYPDEPQAAAAIIRLAFEDGDQSIRKLAGKSLRLIKSDAVVASGGIDKTISALQNPDEVVAENAAWFLGEIQREPMKVVPALLRASQDPRFSVATTAFFALERYPAQAKTIADALKAKLLEPQVLHREKIEYFLRELQAEGGSGNVRTNK